MGVSGTPTSIRLPRQVAIDLKDWTGTSVSKLSRDMLLAYHARLKLEREQSKEQSDA